MAKNTVTLVDRGGASVTETVEAPNKVEATKAVKAAHPFWTIGISAMAYTSVSCEKVAA